MRLILNGVEGQFDLGADQHVAGLVAALGLRPEIVAIEVNGELVPRAAHGDCGLVEGDRVECVTLVGGG